MSVFLPCLNVDTGNNLSGSGIQIVSPESVAAGLVNLAGTAIPVTIGETVLFLNPFTSIIAFAINWNFWSNLFGLGETRIDREKAEIQDVYGPIFRYLNSAYGVPVRDNHALNFPSDGVQKQFAARPEIAAMVPLLMQTSPIVTKYIFAHGMPPQGELERTVNQFLANASINNWPVGAVEQIWNGLVEAADPACSQDASRWTRNPLLVRAGAIAAVLLKYIPLNVLLDMSVLHGIGDSLVENILKEWANHPDLVKDTVTVTGLPWQSIYTEGRWALPPYNFGFGFVVPLLERDHIIPIVSAIQIAGPRYPSFTTVVQPIPPPTQPPSYIPPPQPPSEPPPGTPQPPPQPPPVQPPSPTPIPQPPGPGPGPQPPPELPPPEVQYTQAQRDYACYISRLLYGNSQLTQSELAWYNDFRNVGLLNQMINVEQCKQAIVRPVPQPDTPHPPQWTSEELDIACYISRLLYGNSVLSDDEAAWTHDVRNSAILTYQVNNPQCKTPLRREQPGDVPTPQHPGCPTPQPLPPPSHPQGPVWPIPPLPTDQPPGPQPCPPECQHQIDVLRQRQQECCDELEQSIVPRVVDLERWVWDIERRVPGQPPVLPTPYPLPPVEHVPGTDIPFPPPDEPPPPLPPVDLPPITDCDSPFVLSLLDCLKQKIPGLDTAKKVVLDACQFGLQAWGWMAECWLDANTPQQSVPIALPTKLQSLEEISKSFDDHLAGRQTDLYLPGIEYGTALIDYGLRLRSDLPSWPVLPDDLDVDYIFVDRSTSPTIELPITEESVVP